MDLNGFDANAVEPNTSYEPLPAGWYTCIIASSEEKPTKAQTGSYLQLNLQVVDGPHQGRTVFERLNLNNPNAVAVDIAQKTLSSICRAVGVMMPRESSELHDKPMSVKVKIEPASNGYDASNSVAAYEAASAAPAAAAPAAAAPAAAAPASPPWKKAG